MLDIKPLPRAEHYAMTIMNQHTWRAMPAAERADQRGWRRARGDPRREHRADWCGTREEMSICSQELGLSHAKARKVHMQLWVRQAARHPKALRWM